MFEPYETEDECPEETLARVDRQLGDVLELIQGIADCLKNHSQEIAELRRRLG